MSETIHATALLVGRHGILIRGASGAGKSMLALRLIEAGGRLVADDRVHLSACHGRVVATAPAPISGMVELAGHGILRVPYEASAVIRLVVDWVAEQELDRLPESSEFFAELLGVAVPRQPVAGDSERAVILVQAALRSLV
jgi:serine kinase of HPr protein (carbohydrate metabolism regulator)